MFHGFIQAMLDTTNDVEIQSILDNKLDEDVVYLAVGIFASNELVNELTKKFSLVR